jgi:diguanylate cyclase (GGDEF)-like protein
VVDSPHLRLLQALDAAVVLFRATDDDPVADLAAVEQNAAALRLGLPVADRAVLDAARRARLLNTPGQCNATAADGSRLEVRFHPLSDGWVGAVATVVPSTVTDLDPLTGLGNRSRFLELLQQELAAGDGPVAAFLVDVDRLQEVNATLGHHQGDVLLRQAALRLQRLHFLAADPCRVGSDEFGLIGRLATDRPEQLASAVAAAFGPPFVLGRLSVRATASVGVAVGPGHGTDAESLLRSADVALSNAKEHHGVAVYRADRDRFNLRRLQLLTGLRDAINLGGLTLKYQPKVDLKSGKVVGAEALVRWHHDELGEIPPGEFVPLAEERGLIGPLSEWVLSESGGQCGRWVHEGFDVGVSANISARNLYDPGLVRWLGRLFDEGIVTPGRLTLELTETQIAEDLPMARQILRRLQSIGARLSIDDFGTGYSSLSYLSKLPLDELKIDRSFVLDLESGDGPAASMVQTIIALGHDLGLHVVAEGVETGEMITTLQDLGCDQAQGYHVSRPLSAGALEDWMTSGPFAQIL